MSVRECSKCKEHMPPETKHYEVNDEVYCLDCVEIRTYEAYQIYINGEFEGDSEHSDVCFVDSYEDEYEEE